MSKNRYLGKLRGNTGTFKDRNTGEEKKAYNDVGAVFINDETGLITVKLDTVPVSPEWSGWLYCNPGHNRVPSEEEGGRPAAGQDPAPTRTRRRRRRCSRASPSSTCTSSTRTASSSAGSSTYPRTRSD